MYFWRKNDVFWSIKYTLTKTMTELECQPLIKKFVGTYETFLDSMHIPHYSEFSIIKDSDNIDYLNYIIECSKDFIEVYMQCNLTHEQKYKIIEEYGMKKLIDLHVSYEGNSICLELLNLDEHIDTWVHLLLMNVVTLY